MALETPSSTQQVETSQPAANEDPFLWLEEVEGEQALAWVRSQNERSLSELESRPDYADNLAKATAIATSKERIAYGTIRDGYVY
ncbi:MAG: S9 family peptidase, partial [Alphaproteobacteria bacterium]|nr:S9 family peptidase [Alphaproteobacteria bacterium]